MLQGAKTTLYLSIMQCLLSAISLALQGDWHKITTQGNTINKQGPIFLKLIIFNPSLDIYMQYKVWVKISYPLENFNSAAAEVWEGSILSAHIL